MNRGGAAAEPDDGDEDDEDAFDEGGDRVCDRGDHGKQHESDDVLAKVEDAVEDELECQSAMVEGRGFIGELDGTVREEVAEDGKAFRP